jgi:hypothetical protein
VRRGPASGPQLVIVQPLFEEMNRCRRLLADTTRRLAGTGIASWLFDLPATGDSPLPTSAGDWAAWRAAVAAVGAIAARAGPVHALSLRGGALLDDALPAHSLYRLAPIRSGERILREMLRTRVASDAEFGAATTLAALEAELSAGRTVDVGGYALTAGLAADMRAAVPANAPRLRTAIVGNGAADVVLDGAPVWRQAEPGAVDAFGSALATDIVEWIESCAAR